MLKLSIEGRELWDEKNECFIFVAPTVMMLEHSLLSISKWESKMKVPFFRRKSDNFSVEEYREYIRCMTINDVPESVYLALTAKEFNTIAEYMNDACSATKFYEKNQRGGGNHTITSERIYYYMVAFGIPFECENWNVNRLINLIRICEAENRPKKKSGMTSAERAKLNAARKAKYHTRG